MVGVPGRLAAGAPDREIPVVRAISRLVGGSSIQAITLTRELEPLGYRTTLVTGAAGAEEGTMEPLAARLRVAPVRLPGLQRSLGPHDLRAMLAMRRLLRDRRPQILHTHAAKGGTVGRIAAATLGRARPPVIVHTFHGHVLRGYFNRGQAAFYTRVERQLAKGTTAIVAVAPEVKHDLVELGVAPEGKIEVVPLGFDLDPFLHPSRPPAEQRAAMRARLGLAPDAQVVSLIARLVPIKRVDRFLRVARLVAGERPETRFAVIGNGKLEDELRSSPAALALGDRLVWGGYQEDMPAVCFASDVVALTSDNEGTPVSLIEAHAAGLPAISTEVGGVRQVVEDGVSGFIRAREDEAGLARAISALLSSDGRAAEMGARGRERVAARYTLARLSADIDALYRELLAGRAD